MKTQRRQQREFRRGHSRSTVTVVKEYFQRERIGSRARIHDDHVQLTVGSGPDEFIVYIDGLDDGPYHRIHVASIWDIDLPVESSQRILEAIQIINDFSIISTVSAFVFDQKLSISTSLELDCPVHDVHVQYALEADLDLADKCVEPLFAIAFHAISVGEIAKLFKRPQAKDIH